MNTRNQKLQGMNQFLLEAQRRGKLPFLNLTAARIAAARIAVAKIGLAILILVTPLFEISRAAAGGPNPDESNPAAPETANQASADRRYFMPTIAKGRASSSSGAEWPMAAANPARTSSTAEEVRGELKPAWYKYFDSYISQKVQIIAAGNSLFISTSAGLSALDPASGNERWFYPTQLPLGNSPTYYNGTVYVGGFDKKIHAINAQNGQGLWTFEGGAGFETNPLIVEGKLFAGNRDGFLYAIYADGPNAGQLAWKFKTDGPVLYSAAYQDGVVYFASNDNYAYALRAQDGQQVWKSALLPGHGFHSWWPVVYQDSVVFAGSYNYRYADPFQGPHTVLEKEAYPAGSSKGSPIGPEGTEPGGWMQGTKTIDASSIAQYFEQNPQRRTYIVLNRANGQEFTYDSDGDGRPEYAPVLWFGTHSGTRYPPVVGPDGVLYQSNNLFYDPAIPRGKISGWKFGTPIVSSPSGSGAAVDEPLAYSVGGNVIYWKHCCDRTAGAFEVYSQSGSANDLDSWNYYDQGGRTLRRTLPDLFEKGWPFAYWKHGDTTPPIPYQGRVYLIANNAVVALSPDGKNPVLPGGLDGGSFSGEEVEAVEREQTFQGLNTKVTLGNNAWPLLITQETYYHADTLPDVRARYFRLLEVTAAGESPGALNVQEGDISTLLSSSFGANTLRTRVSQRSPSTLFETDSNIYQLNGRLAGIAFPSGSGVQVRTGSATINGGDLTAGWLLAWDSTDGHRWVPLIISLQHRPNQISFSSSGLQLSFPGAAGFLAVTPLYGMSAPVSNEVNAWPGGIPAETVARVQTLDSIARAYPETAAENWSFDPNSANANITYAYNYVEFGGDWNMPVRRLAYLPPTLALAAWNGSPIRINGTPLEQHLDLAYLTPLGRVAGAADTNTANVLLPGISSTWRNVPAPTPNFGPSDPLQQQLAAEVQKMLNAGHLLPAYGIVGIWESKAQWRLGDDLVDYWKNPADTVYTLLRALPLLSPEMQAQVKAYVQNEFQNYPLYSTAHVGWDKGASREWFALPPEVESSRSNTKAANDTQFNGWKLPPQNIYALWMYASQFGNAGQFFREAQSKIDVDPQFKISMPYVLNSYISGYIGYLRLAQAAGAGAQTDIEKTLTNLLVMRAALSKYPAALQQTGFEYGGYAWTLRTFSPNQADTLFNATLVGSNWSQLRLYGFPIDLRYGGSGAGMGGDYAFAIDFVNLVPELASFMRNYVPAEAEAEVNSYSQRAPYWFVANAEEAGGEGVFQPPYDRVAFFQARAMILQQNRSQLERYLDIPSVRVGDLFFIQNLVSILQTPR